MKILGVRKRFYYPPLIALICAYIIAAVSPSVEATLVYKVLPAFVYYTAEPSIIGEGNAATCKGLFVVIDPEHRDNGETLEHELVHVRQAYRYLLLHWIPCYISGDFLAEAEAEAYARTGMSHESDSSIYAKMIKDEYSPDTNVAQIEKQLRHYWRLEHVHTDS
jgi:hypothetical protein